MICPKCGNELPDGSKFCDVCGAWMEASESTPVPPPPTQQTPPSPIQTPQPEAQQAVQPVPPQSVQQPAYRQPQPPVQQMQPQDMRTGLSAWAAVLIGIGAVLLVLIIVVAVAAVKISSDSGSVASNPTVVEDQAQQSNTGTDSQAQQNNSGSAQEYNAEDDFFAGGVDQAKVDSLVSQDNDQGSDMGDADSDYHKTFTVDSKYDVNLTITGEPSSYIQYTYEGEDYGDYFYYMDHNVALVFPNEEKSDQLLTEEYLKGEEMTIGGLTGWFYHENDTYCFITPYSAYYNGGTGMMAAFFYGEDENTTKSYISSVTIEPVIQ